MSGERRALRRFEACLVIVALCATSGSAAAQSATALDRFEPSPSGDDLFATPSAAVPGELRPSGGLALEYGHDPLVLKRVTAGGRETFDPIVDHQLTLHVLGSLELFRRLKVDVDVPFTASQGGDSPSAGGGFTSPSGAAMNDVRAGLRVELLRQDGLAPSAALAGCVWFPTGDRTAFTGTGHARYEPSIVVGAAYPRLVWSAAVGRRFQGDGTGGLLASDVVFAAGVAPRLGRLQVGPEVLGSTVTGGGVGAFSRTTTSLEALLGARYGVGPIVLGAAGGPGLSAGAGTPDFRLVAEVSYAAPQPPASAAPPAEPSRDRALPAPPAPPPRGPDADGDGVLDPEDACPEVIGDASPTARRRGCPPDRDGDGVIDAEDRCPDDPGEASTDAARNGCPADTDGDGVFDREDACPRERGPRTSDPKTSGCPTSVRVEGEQIVILQQVRFATGRDAIDPQSFPLLQEVADVLAQHPEIARLAVDGHTDGVGSAKENVALSQRRAVAVVRWLTEHGVDARRVEARGFGPRRPIADNGSEEGRAKNRRVEFLIRKKTPDGKAGWIDGPLE